MADMQVLHILGGESASGAYLLRISAARDLDVQFGRFAGGALLRVAAGVYVYVGSARGGGLAARLLRHASRTTGQPPQAIWRPLAQGLLDTGLLSSLPDGPRPKKLHWHVDYLLEQPAAALTAVLAIRSEQILEDRLARWLAARPDVAALQAGLGASDAPGQTHLLRVPESIDWWARLPDQIMEVVDGES